MELYDSLYEHLLKAAINKKIDEELQKLKGFDPYQLNCLLNPEKHSTVIRIGDCQCSDEQKDKCINECEFGAIHKDENGNIIISDECLGCAKCINTCIRENLTDKKDILPVFELLNEGKVPIYAMIAPAFTSQYGQDVTPGKLRTAFKKLGFAGMIEVALFADMLTLKEAMEFDIAIKDKEDFVLTSCCCPMWIGMIKRIYNDLIPHVPPSVSNQYISFFQKCLCCYYLVRNINTITVIFKHLDNAFNLSFSRL